MEKVKELSNDDILKLKATVLYILRRCGQMDYFHLFKILYFADRLHLAKYARRIVQDTFCAMKFGPVPSHLYNVVKDVIGKEPLPPSSPLKSISDAIIQSDNEVYPYFLQAKEDPDMDELSLSDVAELDQSIQEHQSSNFGELSAKSHDQAWQKAYSDLPNSGIDPILMAQSGGATEGDLELIRALDLFLR